MKPQATFLERLRNVDVETLVENGAGLSLDFAAGTSRPGREPVPLVVSDGTRGKASIFSPSAHYLDYPLLEMGRRSSPARKLALATLGSPWGAVFRATALDRVVYVNHWLLSSAPPLELEHDELDTLIEEVRNNYPGRALIFSGIVPSLTPQLSATLLALGGRAVQSRIVHLLDRSAPVNGPSKKGARQTRNTDRKLYEKRLPDRTTDRDVLLAHVVQMRQLYSQLYLAKYSQLNPQYTEEFFAILLKSSEFQAAGWVDNGRLEAFNIQLVEKAVNHWSICGYDVSAPKDKALFRLIAAEDMLGSAGHRLVNWGGGNASFKKFRGAQPALEFDIVFDAHLSARRRIPWRLLRELRGRRNGHTGPMNAATLPSVASARPVMPEEASGPTAFRRIGIVTSNPALVAPFLALDLTALGLEVPVVILLRSPNSLRDRLRSLRPILKRQAKINGTQRWLQLMYRVLYYNVASGRENRSAERASLAADMGQLTRNRRVVDAESANDADAVSGLLAAGCDLILVVGADVLTRKTLAAIDLPLVNLHLSDPSFVRGMPAVFWEIRAGRNEIALTLHRLVLDLDAGPVLAQREVAIQWRTSLSDTIAATRRVATREIAVLLAESLPRILSGELESRVVARGALRTIPSLRDVLIAAKVCRARAGDRSRSSGIAFSGVTGTGQV